MPAGSSPEQMGLKPEEMLSDEEIKRKYKEVFGIELPTETGKGIKMSDNERTRSGKDALGLFEEFKQVYGDEAWEFNPPNHLEIIKTLEDAVNVAFDYKKLFDKELPDSDEDGEEFLDVAEKIDYSRRKILEKAFNDGLINKEKVYSKDKNGKITKDWKFVSFYESNPNNLRVLLLSNKEDNNSKKISQREFYKLNRHYFLDEKLINEITMRNNLIEITKDIEPKIFTTAGIDWWIYEGEKFTEYEDRHLFRGYLQIKVEDIPETVKIIRQAIKKATKTEKAKTGLKYLLGKVKDEEVEKYLSQIYLLVKRQRRKSGKLSQLREEVYGRYENLKESDPRLVVYAQEPKIITKIFAIMTQNAKLKEISNKMWRKESMHGEMTYRDEEGNVWYGLEYNTHEGHTKKRGYSY